MKIVHYVLSETFAGIEQHVQELSMVQATNNEVTIICNPSISRYFSHATVIEVTNISRRSIFGILKLLNTINKLKPDIVHSHGSKTTSIINSVKKVININHVCSVHGIKSNTKVYSKADAVIAGSIKIQDSLNVSSYLVENWWHPALPKSIDKTNEYILAIGRLEPVKGFDLLIKSWVGIDKKLLIVGDGPEHTKLKQLISDNELNDKISIVNSVAKDKLIDFYKKASLLIISSRREGGPRVALEALYLKIPVISTRVGHMEQILPGELLAEPDDLNSLKRLIGRWVDASFKQDSIFQYVAEEFSLEKKAKKVFSVYEDLLSKS